MTIIRRSCLGLLGAGAITVGLVQPATAAPRPEYNDHYTGYVTPPGAYTDAGAVFTVPQLNCGLFYLPHGYAGASEWVGLGGVSGGPSGSEYDINATPLLQDGISSECRLGIQTNQAFWEVVPGNMAQDFHKTVKAGDQIYASVAYLGGGKYAMSLADVNKAHGWRVHKYYTSSDTREGTTAEWIIEPGQAPAVHFPGIPDPWLNPFPNLALADFGNETFYDSSYSTDAQHGIFLGGTGSVSPVKFIQGSSRNPVASVSSVNSGGEFSVNYLAKRHVK
jgi:hypothetical protein